MKKKTGNLFTTAYLVLMFTLYPLYMKQGYTQIGKDKYHFFLYCSLGAAVILTVITFIRMIKGSCLRKKIGLEVAVDWNCLTATDLFVMLYGTITFLSFSISEHRQEALLGTEGWYMGLVTQLILCVLYFFVSRLWDGGWAAPVCAVATSGIICLLMILNRFSVFLLPMENRPNTFLATIGNINWICGYLSVIMPIGICLFVFSERRWVRLSTGIYAIVGFGAIVTQGASSAFLFLAALLFLLLWVALYKFEWRKRLLLLFILWCFTAVGMGVLRDVFQEAYQYDTNNLCGYLTDSKIPLWLGIAGIILYMVIRNRKPGGDWRIKVSLIHKLMLGFLLAGICLWFILLAAKGSSFGLNDDWGNGRGATMKAGLWIFRELPLTNKLLGVGPDCFSAQAYTLPELAEFLHNNFGNSRLTNAHCELLTNMVNIGIVGVLMYIGMFLSFVSRCMKKGKEEPALFIAGTCVICYFIHNMVSFAQIMNYPFVILLMAMGEKLLTNSAKLPTIEVQSVEQQTDNVSIDMDKRGEEKE